MPLPRVDVLLPVLRARPTLPDAVGDVVAQIDVDVRVLAVVDTAADGSDDGSRAWLQQRARAEPRLRVLDGPGRGAAAALQLGLDATEAPLVSHMEADDRCPPHRLATLAAALAADPTLDAMTSCVEQIGDTTEGMARYLAWQNGLRTPEAMAAERFVEIPALHQTGLYRAEALRAVGGYVTRGPWPPDIDFWFRWFEAGRRVAKDAEVLYRWRQHGGQSTRGGGQHDLDALRAAKIDALERLHGADGRDPRGVMLLSVGATLRAWERDLADSRVELLGAASWRPGRALPPEVRATMPGAAGAASDTAPAEAGPRAPLLLAAYGRAEVRDRVRAALAPLREPHELLFTA